METGSMERNWSFMVFLCIYGKTVYVGLEGKLEINDYVFA